MRLVSEALGKVLWFTGYSGSGKSTLCRALAEELRRNGHAVRILDGDVLRRGLCADLSFEVSDRMENVRRSAHVAELMSEQGTIVLVAVICPLESLRQVVRSILPDFIQVFVDAPLAVCEQRDPKGLYKKARAGLLRGFTGIDSAFEPPAGPDVVCRTDRESVSESAAKVLEHLRASHHAIATPTLDDYRGHRTIAVDFDGVIANYDGWRGEETLGSPREDVRAALLCLKSEGWKIVVHTTRAAGAITPYLRSAGFPFDEINSNSDYANLGPKPVATVYWDDRAICYSGDASRDLSRIREFRTWNQRR